MAPLFPTEDLRNDSVIHIEIPRYFKQLKENLDLKHLCREGNTETSDRYRST